MPAGKFGFCRPIDTSGNVYSNSPNAPQHASTAETSISSCGANRRTWFMHAWSTLARPKAYIYLDRDARLEHLSGGMASGEGVPRAHLRSALWTSKETPDARFWSKARIQRAGRERLLSQVQTLGAAPTDSRSRPGAVQVRSRSQILRQQTCVAPEANIRFPG